MSMRFVAVCLLFIGSISTFVTAEDWPQFRGPAQGHAQAIGLPTTWSETENVAWKTPIPGKGYSSPVILGNQIWLTTAFETAETEENAKKRLAANTGNQPLNVAGEVAFHAICVDRTTGNLLHNIKLFTQKEPQWIHAQNSYASPTPVLEKGRLYCHFGAYGTGCLDTQSGKILWTNREHLIMHENGPGGSPVLHDDMLIFHCDGSDAQYIAALDKTTGKTKWKTDRSGAMNSNPQLKKAYGTPILVEISGKTVLVSPAADWLYGYNPSTGRELWKMNYETLGFSIVPLPVVSKGVLYMSTSFMQPHMLAVRFDGSDGTPEPHVIWREKKSIPTMTSPIVVGDKLYVIHDNGGVLSCLKADSGEVVFRDRVEGKFCASPLFADGKLYFCDREGVTSVVAPGDTLQILAKNKLDSAIMASPAALDRALFIRTETALYRIEEKK